MLSRSLALSLALLAVAATAQPTEEVPFITSPDNVTLEMLSMAGVGARDHVIDLGSGDGRIVILAAKRFGATGLGVEIDPQLVQRSQRSAQEAGVAERVAFKVQDLFATDLSAATVITMYLLPEFNLQLRPGLLALKPGTRVVSHDWDMGDWRPDRTTVVPVPDKKVGLEKSSKVHLWVVPAKVDGVWCGVGGTARLQVAQRYQVLQARLEQPGRSRAWDGRIEGALLQLDDKTSLQLDGEQLRVAQAPVNSGLERGAVFARAPQGRCG